MQYESITPFAYFYENTKLFIKFIGAHYKKDEEMLEKIYLDTLNLYQQYIEEYLDKNQRKEKYKEIIYELLELFEMREQNEVLRIKDVPLFKGIKIKEMIMGTRYIELWVKGKKIWLYIYENRNNKEHIVPYKIEKPYLINTEQAFHILKDKLLSTQKPEHKELKI